MLGLECWRRALATGAGTESRFTGRRASPERAPHAAAGIANSDRSPENTSTLVEGLPRAAEWKRSMAAARWYGSLPSITAVLKPLGRAMSLPIRITWASFDRSDPFGWMWFSVSLVTAGRSPPSVSISGALMGVPARTEAEIASCQLPWSTSTTAVGFESLLVAGKTALATPAASEAAAPPPTPVAVRGALGGEASLAAASLSLDLAPSCGGRPPSSPPMLQPARQTPAPSSASGAVLLLLQRSTSGGR